MGLTKTQAVNTSDRLDPERHVGKSIAAFGGGNLPSNARSHRAYLFGDAWSPVWCWESNWDSVHPRLPSSPLGFLPSSGVGNC